jgi:hypothetical protein
LTLGGAVWSCFNGDEEVQRLGFVAMWFPSLFSFVLLLRLLSVREMTKKSTPVNFTSNWEDEDGSKFTAPFFDLDIQLRR